ncbi:MAG TPA: hypothetical protein ENK82_02465 [Campylobacterales bacterium]|nr:hypothetical protein [Campylobacterales bacterium]
MKHYLLGTLVISLFLGCSQKHQINIGTIALNEATTTNLKHKEYYMSFTQEYYDNKLYPLHQYCADQRNYLTNDKFSTETYLKISNERTKQERIGKYPIWFLLNDDASKISCVRKSANFINSEPFVVSENDALSVKLFQKNEVETSVPVRELGILIDFVSLVVPRTANFLLKTNNIIQDPVTQNYLDLLDDAFKNGDFDGTKSRDFKVNMRSIDVKLYVPTKNGDKRELGFISLKPKYRTTLSTVNEVNGIPNFRFIYDSNDPQIEDLMQYELKKQRVRIKIVVDNFKQVAQEHTVEALASLNTHLVNKFTRFDRALVLNLALRQSGLYRSFVESIRSKNMVALKRYLTLLDTKKNPLTYLTEELSATKCEYIAYLEQARSLLRHYEDVKQHEDEEAKRIKEEALRHQIAMQSIENFLSPVANWNYINQMFTQDAKIVTSLNEVLTLDMLKKRYHREHNVSAYGCYVDLTRPIHGTTIQEYLIHPSYVQGEVYNYMALSLNKNNETDIIFYKLNSDKHLKISKIFIDMNSRFISRHRISEVINTTNAPSCTENLRKLF